MNMRSCLASLLVASLPLQAVASPAELVASAPLAAEPARPLPWLDAASSRLQAELGTKLDEGARARLARGIKQVCSLWRAQDGDAAAFSAFARTNFAADPASQDALFGRFQDLLESVDGHMDEIMVALRRQSDLDLGPILPFDEAFAGYDPSAHLNDDLFANKLAFVVLLNFPLTTLEERLAEGPKWTRRQWAEARLASRFSKRVPADVQLAISQADARAGRYIADYNIWMHHVLDEKGDRLFPPKLRLLSHWNLRDELKANYSEPKTALPKQRAIQKVMERIVTQTIPAAVIDKPFLDWNPYSNEVKPAPAAETEEPAPADLKADARPEPDTRYATLRGLWAAARLADPHSPTTPSLISRRFDEDREIPEARARQMLEQVLSSPLAPKVAALIQSRLGRKLEPFDIWYSGFKPNAAYTEAQLDEIVVKRFPDAAAFKKGMPELLTALGFPRERAEYLASRIEVEPARGSGHAWGGQMRSEPARLRTRVPKGGMNYKGFNIAIHELGHNVEQVTSLNDIDHTLLRGVPNTAFTEALAFVFQGRDLELLGLSKPDEKTRALKTLEDFWATFEIAGVSLVDIGVWHWMYDHPQATPAELRDATVSLAKQVWNQYYAPLFEQKDVVLLGIYSHMIDEFLYLPDYPIGHLIAFQINEKIGDGPVGPEFDRMARLGRVTPDEWMLHATGKQVGPEALLAAAEKALKTVSAKP